MVRDRVRVRIRTFYLCLRPDLSVITPIKVYIRIILGLGFRVMVKVAGSGKCATIVTTREKI